MGRAASLLLVARRYLHEEQSYTRTRRNREQLMRFAMPRHRLATEADHYRLPAPPPVTIQPGSFQLCPSGINAACCPDQFNGLAELYKLAFEQAVASARDSHPARVLFALWN